METLPLDGLTINRFSSVNVQIGTAFFISVVRSDVLTGCDNDDVKLNHLSGDGGATRVSADLDNA